MSLRNRERSNPGKTLLVVLAAIPFLYPFIFLLSTAGKTNAEFVRNPSGLPSHLTFANISAAWRQARLGPAMMHSVIAVVFSVGVTVVISCAAGFWFLRHQGVAARLLRGVLVGTMALPPPVFIIPLYVLLNGLSLTDNLLVLGLVYGTTNAAFGLYLMSSYYERGIPVDVLEASELDGASPLRQFLSVVLPLADPQSGRSPRCRSYGRGAICCSPLYSFKTRTSARWCRQRPCSPTVTTRTSPEMPPL